MARILAVADEVSRSLIEGTLKELEVDLTVGCGDLPFDYLEYLVTILGVPLVYVPGNHDPDLHRRAQPITPQDMVRPFSLPFRHDDDAPGPRGCINADGRVVKAAGLHIAGLGGSVRYSQGANQYTQRQMQLRALSLQLRIGLGHLGPVDVLITHAPPLGVGDGDDPSHQGFAAFHRLVSRLHPKVVVHGHVHPYGRGVEDHRLDGATVINAVGHRVIET